MLSLVSPVVRRRRRRPHHWRRLLEWSLERPAVLVGWGILGLFLLVGAWCGWTAWATAQDLEEVESRARLLRSELIDGDADGAARALEGYQDAAASAKARTDGPTWWLVERIPVLGDDAQAVETVSAVLAELGTDALPQLVEAAEQVAARAFNPTDHRFPLDTIAATREPAQQSEQAFAEAAATLEEVDSEGFVGPVRQSFDQLRGEVLSARSTLGSVFRAAELMPMMLGGEDDRNYLLVFQNNAELRSLGGLAGSVSVIRADEGRIDIVDQAGTSGFGAIPRSVLPLTADERRLFGAILGQYFMNASLTPDVPRASALMATRWEQEVGGHIDGVFFVDPVATSYLLRAIGPVQVPGYGAVDATNVVAEVENRIYLETSNREEQEDYQNAVAKAVFNAFADGRGDPADVIRELVVGVAEGRIRMHATDPDEQARIAGTAIAGELPSVDDGDGPGGAPDSNGEIGIYFNDATASKMSYYLRYEVEAVARSCAGNVQEVVGTIEITNATPEGAELLPPSVTGIFPGSTRYGEIEPGQQYVLTYLMAPPGGEIQELELDGRAINDIVIQEFEGRDVATVLSLLDPGESQTVDVVVTTASGQTEPVDIVVTPGAWPGTESETLRSAC